MTESVLGRTTRIRIVAITEPGMLVERRLVTKYVRLDATSPSLVDGIFKARRRLTLLDCSEPLDCIRITLDEIDKQCGLRIRLRPALLPVLQSPNVGTQISRE